MDLTPVSTTLLKARQEKDDNDSRPLLTEVTAPKTATPPRPTKITSVDEALESLRSQPDYDALILTLRYLHNGGLQSAPGPQSAAIVRLLVTEIAPNYWALLRSDGSEDIDLFIRCLRSVTGLNALVAHLRSLIQDSKGESKEVRRPDIPLNLNLLLEILDAVLKGDDAIQTLWDTSISGLSTPALQRAQSQALLSVLTGGRLVSATAEAASIAGSKDTQNEFHWITDGHQVTSWLGRNLATWAQKPPADGELRFCSDLFQRALSLGYSDTLIKSLVDLLVLSSQAKPDIFARICLSSPSQATRVLNTLLNYLSDTFLGSVGLDEAKGNEAVAAVAGAVHSVTKDKKLLAHDLVKWCVAASGAGLGRNVSIRRAVVAVLAQDRDTVTTVLEKSMAQFGDELYIKHAPFLQQKAHSEVLLLSAGYVNRLSPIKLAMLIRSGSYLSTISNRIAAAQPNARFLGMIVGESLSGLIDNKEKRLDFKMEEMDTDEAERLKNLVNTADSPGSLEPLISHAPTQVDIPPKKPSTAQRKPQRQAKKKPRPAPEAKPKAIIQEVFSSDEEDDLEAYEKGSDPEDSDDDPTLVNRNQIKPPVYIRDLIAYFRDTESFDKQKLALRTAPVLIRRKANYGTEVSLHAEELAGLLVGVQDKFAMDDFDKLRLESIISLIVAQPKTMAPWFARTFFEGDYSLSQRTSVLIALGLSARDLAGYEKSEHQDAAEFASKRLPEKIERLYLDSTGQSAGQLEPASRLQALPSTALESITQSLTASFLEPLAAEAADATTGPDALKLETFTTRYKSRSAKKPRVRAIPNTTAAVIAGSFFSPLTAHFQFALRSARPVVLHPTLLGLYLQTLGIMIHAAGPSTLSLPQLTAEMWSLLLGVRQHVLGDMGATRGWLVAMAVLLEVNEGDMRRLCETQGREVVETREWVSGVFERTRGGPDADAADENKVKMLAAGVLIRLGEAIERYQALLMGDMIGF